VVPAIVSLRAQALRPHTSALPAPRPGPDLLFARRRISSLYERPIAEIGPCRPPRQQG
jgi:hypothetical protein